MSRERWYLLGVFLLGSLIVVSRRPDALSNPQFFIEDGPLWYAQAHDIGWHTLFMPSHRGYFHTVDRLVAVAAQYLPLRFAPLFFNVFAIAVEAFGALLLASRRFAEIVPSRGWRLFLGLSYVALPASWGAISNMTHSQYHLSIFACLVVLAGGAITRTWQIVDVIVVGLSGLTGPTCIALAPLAALVWVKRRTVWSAVLAGITVAAALIQGISLIFNAAPVETHVPLGASARGLIRLIGWRVTLAPLIGQRTSLDLYGASVPWLAVVAAIVGLAILAYALIRAPFELGVFVCFGLMALGMALIWPVPMNTAPGGYWATLTEPGVHVRYFLPPTFALVASLVWMVSRHQKIVRGCAALSLAAMVLYAMPRDWREPAYRDYHFAEYVQKYESAEPGERVQIPVPPGWSMFLVKR